MMDKQERLGLGVSTAGHVLLFGALSLGLLNTTSKLPPPPTTMDVSLAETISLESTTPERAPDVPQVAQAPELGEPDPDTSPPAAAAPPAAAPSPKPPEPVTPTPSPRAIEPAPAPPAPAKRTPAKAATRPAPAAPSKAKPSDKPAKPARASRLGDDFLKGIDSDTTPTRNSQTKRGANAPMGAVAARALNAEITRQIKPNWRPPSGADAEKLVTLLSVRLDESGRITGPVEVIGQEGVTPSNRAQADLHAERAVQAVMRSSPFKNLPPEYYEQWKWLRPLRIYASLGQ